MHLYCHRCHGELPPAAPGNKQSSDDAMLFCPRCSAPQILLPEHMRIDPDGDAASHGRTTGATPPPRPFPGDSRQVPSQIDWRAALSVAGVVALVGAVLAVLGIRSGAASTFDVFWLLSGAVIALGMYVRTRPLARIDARIGARIGLVTGMLSISAVIVALATAGVIARFGLHRMGFFDTALAQQFAAIALQMQQNQSADMKAKVIGLMSSEEIRGGLALFYVGFLSALLLLLSAAGGAFAGMMRGGRFAGRRGEP